MRAIVGTAGFMFTALLAGCAPGTSYHGDGRLVDHGVTAPDFRYVIEPGTIDLTTAGSKTFRMSGLPRDFFVIGLRLPDGADHASPANVSLELVKDGGEMVALVTRPLRDWTWSNPHHEATAFVYLKDSPRTFFDAFDEPHYELRVVVNTPDPSLPRDAAVVIQSGGWK